MEHRLKVQLISSVLPKPTGFGEILLYRHLMDNSRIEVQVTQLPHPTPAARLLRRTPLKDLVTVANILGNGRRWDVPTDRLAGCFSPDVLLTVAHGEGCLAAVRFSKRTNIPLVTFFHDWWPDQPELPWWSRG